MSTHALERWSLACDLLELSRGELADEERREKREWAFVGMEKVIECGLLADVVDKGLARDFVVCLEDVMDLNDGVVVVAH